MPIAHQGDLERQVQQIDLASIRAALDPLLADPAVLAILHDAKTDLLAFDTAGFVPAAAVDDVMLISYAQEAGAHAHGLDDLARLHLGHTPKSLDDVTGTGRTRLAFTLVPPDRAAQQAAEAADCALRLWQMLRPRLSANRATGLYEQMERRLIPVLADMERAGRHGGRQGIAPAISRFRRTHGGDGNRYPPPGRAQLQPRQPEDARRDPVRRVEAARRQARGQWRVGHGTSPS